MLATAVGPHLFWITSRAAGIAALLLSSMSVCAGLLIGGRILSARRGELRATHEALSLATLAALAVHGLSLLGDGYLHPSVLDLAIPFLGSYETLWTSIGIVAFWMLLVLGLSYYVRTRIGVQRWRSLHRFAALAWALGVAHALGEGTDAGQVWFLTAGAIVVVPAVVLTLVRLLSSLAGTRRNAAHASRADAAHGPHTAKAHRPRAPRGPRAHASGAAHVGGGG